MWNIFDTDYLALRREGLSNGCKPNIRREILVAFHLGLIREKEK